MADTPADASASGPLDAATQAAYAERLRARETETLAQMQMNAKSAQPPSLDEEIGRLTRMDALQQQQMALHAGRRLEVQLSRIRGALMRIDERTFGACAMCGARVPPRRLELVPETPFCLPCLENIESNAAK